MDLTEARVLRVVNGYLNDVRRHLRLDRAAESEVIRELETHIEDSVSEMEEAGFSEQDAAENCLVSLGSASLVARRMYEAHSQGTWHQALMASLPHLVFAGLFALNWWQGVGWLAIVIGVILGTALYGWLHGRPIWLFPWLGYLLVPVIGAGLLLLYLPRGLSWVAVVAYVPLAVWLMWAVAIQIVRRDWLYGALMLLPVPIAICWLLVAAHGAWFLGFNIDEIQEVANWIGLSFFALAATALVFVRLRQRSLRIGLLLVSGLSILTSIATHVGGRLDFGTYLLLALMTVGLLLSPALLDRRLRKKEYGQEVGSEESVAGASGENIV
jgi:hypothetical protein